MSIYMIEKNVIQNSIFLRISSHANEIQYAVSVYVSVNCPGVELFHIKKRIFHFQYTVNAAS